MIKSMIDFLKKRYWFGWWWASICSKHAIYNKDCPLCKKGFWTKENHNKLFGINKPKSINNFR